MYGETATGDVADAETNGKENNKDSLLETAKVM